VREAAGMGMGMGMGMGIDIFYAWQLWTIDQNQTQVFEMGSTPTMSV
tara:strand:+ start:790 stop:930 length:141 start_codon:yes stop_codon:yes gene_type:complete